MAKHKTGKVSKKSIEIIKLLKQNPEGLRANTIQKLSNLCTRTLYNHLNKLRTFGIIENIFPIWRLCQNQASLSKIAKLLSSENIQAHKFAFVLTLINKPEWWEKRENKLIKLKEFQFKPQINWGNNSYDMLIRGDFLIQTFSNSIVFVNRKKYLSQDPYDAFIESLEDTLKMLDFIEERFRFKFYASGVPQFSVRSQHYVKLRDEMANRCKKEKNLIRVEINGNLRAWVDLSEPSGMEFGHKNYAPEDANKYKNVVADIISTNTPVPSEIWELASTNTQAINGLAENQSTFQKDIIYYGKQIRSHIKAIQQLGNSIQKFDKRISHILPKTLIKHKSKIEEDQKKLTDF